MRIEYVARNLKNRAGVRLLMACLLAKLHRPEVDVRKPYTEIGEADAFSGRAYDERYITAFINEHNLPCNSTTAFLTPALRNRNVMLTTTLNLVGKPPQLYQYVLELLNEVSNSRIAPDTLLAETIRWLIIDRNEKQRRIEALIQELKTTEGALHLFHRLRSRFLETYQSMILEEPQSAVSQPVKEAFLAMRRAAEAELEAG